MAQQYNISRHNEILLLFPKMEEIMRFTQYLPVYL